MTHVTYIKASPNFLSPAWLLKISPFEEVIQKIPRRASAYAAKKYLFFGLYLA